MVKEGVNLLELLRKQASGADLDFLREAVAVLAEAVMDADVAAQAGPPTASAARRAPPGATATGEALGHPRRQHRLGPTGAVSPLPRPPRVQPRLRVLCVSRLRRHPRSRHPGCAPRGRFLLVARALALERGPGLQQRPIHREVLGREQPRRLASAATSAKTARAPSAASRRSRFLEKVEEPLEGQVVAQPLAELALAADVVARGRIRTLDPQFRRLMLCPLSYRRARGPIQDGGGLAGRQGGREARPLSAHAIDQPSDQF